MKEAEQLKPIVCLDCDNELVIVKGAETHLVLTVWCRKCGRKNRIRPKVFNGLEEHQNTE